MGNKLIGRLLAAMLVKKLKRAREGLDTTGKAFQDLTESITPENVQAWTELERKAISERGPALNVYSVQTDKGAHT
jgi:hypothetical protein